MAKIEFLADDLWVYLRAEAAASRTRHCAVAYVTELESLQFMDGDTLIVDASDTAISCGKTSASALSAIASAGVQIFSVENLHAKIYVFESCVFVGSANLSRNSEKKLKEAAIVSYDEVTIQNARQHVLMLAGAGTKIDHSFIKRISGISVSKQNFPCLPASLTSSATHRLFGNHIWRLVNPPVSKALLRAYFVALIQVQIKEMKSDVPFRLWDGNFKTHLDNRRLRREGKNFVLTPAGVAYFTTGKAAPNSDLLTCFMHALLTGCESDLPNALGAKTMVPFF